MGEDEESIERALHNMGFVWRDVSPLCSSHKALTDIMGIKKCSFPQQIMSVCGSERSQLKSVSAHPRCLQEAIHFGVLYPL